MSGSKRMELLITLDCLIYQLRKNNAHTTITETMLRARGYDAACADMRDIILDFMKQVREDNYE